MEGGTFVESLQAGSLEHTPPPCLQRSSWRLDSLTTKHVLEWLEVTTPEAERVRRTRDSELYFIDKSTATLVVSPDEVEVLQHYRPRAHVAVVTNIHTLPALAHTKCEARSGTLFVGNLNHIPNRWVVPPAGRAAVGLAYGGDVQAALGHAGSCTPALRYVMASSRARLLATPSRAALLLGLALHLLQWLPAASLAGQNGTSTPAHKYALLLAAALHTPLRCCCDCAGKPSKRSSPTCCQWCCASCPARCWRPSACT